MQEQARLQKLRRDTKACTQDIYAQLLQKKIDQKREKEVERIELQSALERDRTSESNKAA
jgi:hypothetical protein